MQYVKAATATARLVLEFVSSSPSDLAESQYPNTKSQYPNIKSQYNTLSYLDDVEDQLQDIPSLRETNQYTTLYSS